MEDDLQKKKEDDLKKWNKMEDDLKKKIKTNHFFVVEKLEWRPQKKWKMTSKNQSTKFNLIGCDTIVNSPSLIYYSNTLVSSELDIFCVCPLCSKQIPKIELFLFRFHLFPPCGIQSIFFIK